MYGGRTQVLLCGSATSGEKRLLLAYAPLKKVG
jgi:hypothetical protein